VGAWAGGVGPNPQPPNPQSPIPNPQSPIYYLYIYLISKFKIKTEFNKRKNEKGKISHMEKSISNKF
jgi:hypothetical protein